MQKRIIHLNKNSLLPRIDELWATAKISNRMVVGIAGSKLDNGSEFFVEGYSVIRYN